MPDAEFDRIKRYLLDPLVDRFLAEVGQLRKELVAHGKQFEDYLDQQHVDHENRLRSLEKDRLPKWLWPLITAAVGLASSVITHTGFGVK